MTDSLSTDAEITDDELEKAFNDPNPNHRFFEILHERQKRREGAAAANKPTDPLETPEAAIVRLESERDKWLRIAQRLFKERQAYLHGHTYEPTIDDVILDATILEHLEER